MWPRVTDAASAASVRSTTVNAGGPGRWYTLPSGRVSAKGEAARAPSASISFCTKGRSNPPCNSPTPAIDSPGS